MTNRILQSNKIILLAIRSISILAKFLFTALYFQYSEAAFGTYSLVATTILLLVFVLGLDFYSYANRAILQPGSNPQKIIFNQFSLYFVLYILLFPAVYIIFKILKFDPQYELLFYLVLITEHLNFEFYRLLFVFKKPLAANINLFLRNGLWVLAVTFVLYFNKVISLHSVLLFWFLGNIAALMFSLAVSFGKRHKIDLKNFRFEPAWIRKGIIVSIPYILATVAYKTIEFSDRYLIDYFMDKKALGVYSFFANMANVLNILLFTLVVSVLYPVLVEAVYNNNKNAFQKVFKQFKKEIYVYGTGFIGLLSIGLPVILMWIDKSVYIRQFYIFFVLVIGNLILNLSFLYHYVIYAYHKDWKIFLASFGGAVINIILNLILIPYWGIFGAAIATLISFIFILILKHFYYNKLTINIKTNSKERHIHNNI